MSPVLALPFIRMELTTKRLLQVRQTDLIQGYLAFSIASILLALCFWLALRLFSGARFAGEFLRSFAGIATTLALPAFLLYVEHRDRWSLGWPYAAWPMEIGAAILCILLFLTGRFRVPAWLGIFLIAVHYAYWFWTRGNAYLANAVGPIAPALGFFSTLVWAAYVKTLHQSTSRESSPIGRPEVPEV